MNIALPANCWRVAENFCHGADCMFDIRFGLFLCFKLARGPQRDRGEDCSRPGAKIFCREIFACDLTQILVYILGSDIADIFLIIEILK